MENEIIRVATHDEGWGFQRGGEIVGSYPTREEAAIAAKTYADRVLVPSDRNVMILVPVTAE